MHVDADEWLQAPEPDRKLIDAFEEADALGCNCINFSQFVFVAIESENYEAAHYRVLMKTYYFYEPRYPNLVRAWKRAAGLSNVAGAGHSLGGADVKRSSKDLILRHYIMLSEIQARKKYVARNFSETDLQKGWHSTRQTITERNLVVRPHPALRMLPSADSRAFDMTHPVSNHFWCW